MILRANGAGTPDGALGTSEKEGSRGLKVALLYKTTVGNSSTAHAGDAALRHRGEECPFDSNSREREIWERLEAFAREELGRPLFGGKLNEARRRRSEETRPQRRSLLSRAFSGLRVSRHVAQPEKQKGLISR